MHSIIYLEILFIAKVIDNAINTTKTIESEYKSWYEGARYGAGFMPSISCVKNNSYKYLPMISSKLLDMKEEKYVTPKEDLFGLFFKSSSDKEVEQVLEITFDCQEWRDYAISIAEPIYKITEMVYQKGESATDKFTTVFNTLSTYKATAFIIMDSDGKKTDFYVGVRNDETDETMKRSTVTLGDTLKHALVGHFPGIKIKNENRFQIAELSRKILGQTKCCVC